MVESTAKLREEILALSGVDIMLDENTFKSTYQILDEIAHKWEYLTDIQQASVTELIAGKRQGNVVSSLMTNFDTAREALTTSLKSSGSAMREHEKWQESLEARLNSLKASWQSLSQSFLQSDFLKSLLNTVTALVDALDSLIKNFGVLGTAIGGFGLYKVLKTFIPFVLGSFGAAKALIMEIGLSLKNVGTVGLMVGQDIAKSFGAALKVMGKYLAIMGAIKAIKDIASWWSEATNEAETAAEKFDKISDELSSVDSELNSLESELSSVESQIDSLLAKDELTFTEQEELDNLKDISKELERQIKLTETLQKSLQKSQSDAAIGAYGAYSQDTSFYSKQSKMERKEEAKSMGSSIGNIAGLVIGGIIGGLAGGNVLLGAGIGSAIGGWAGGGINGAISDAKYSNEITVREMLDKMMHLERIKLEKAVEDAEAAYKNSENPTAEQKQAYEDATMALNDYNTALSEHMSHLSQYYNSIDYSSLTTDKQKADYIQMGDDLDKYNIEMGVKGAKTTALDRYFSDELIEEEAEQLRSAIETALASGEDIHFFDLDEEIIDSNGRLKEMGITIEEVISYFKDLEKAQLAASSGYDTYDMVSSIAVLSDGVTKLTEAFKEFNETGIVSAATLVELGEVFGGLGDVWMDYVNVMTSGAATIEEAREQTELLAEEHLGALKESGGLKFAKLENENLPYDPETNKYVHDADKYETYLATINQLESLGVENAKEYVDALQQQAMAQDVVNQMRADAARIDILENKEDKTQEEIDELERLKTKLEDIDGYIANVELEYGVEIKNDSIVELEKQLSSHQDAIKENEGYLSEIENYDYFSDVKRAKEAYAEYERLLGEANKMQQAASEMYYSDPDKQDGFWDYLLGEGIQGTIDNLFGTDWFATFEDYLDESSELLGYADAQYAEHEDILKNQKAHFDRMVEIANDANIDLSDINISGFDAGEEGADAIFEQVYNRVKPALESNIDAYGELADELETQINDELNNLGLEIDFGRNFNKIVIDNFKANLEQLGTAMSESISGSGLSIDSMQAIENIFGGLDSFDATALFEHTANGIRLNRTEFSKLNDEFKKSNVDSLEDKMDSLKAQYQNTKNKLHTLTVGTEKYNSTIRDLSAIEAQIAANEELISQYKGVFSAYQEWQRMEASGQERDMYENLIKGLEGIDDEISRGWMDDATIEFLELLTGKELSTAGIEEQKKAYADLDKTISKSGYSIRDFFTVDEDGNSTNTGVYNFLETIEDFEGELGDVIKRNKDDRIIGFNFEVAGGNEAIAKTLGISEELVEIMVRASDDAGFVVDVDGAVVQISYLKERAQDAVESLILLRDSGLKELQGANIDFDLDSDGSTLLDQQKAAIELLERFKKNGKIDFSMEGAEEAFEVAKYLTIRLDDLTQPRYMEIDISSVEENLREPIQKMQYFEELVKRENLLTITGDTEGLKDVETKMVGIVDYIAELDEETKLKLGIDAEWTKDQIYDALKRGEIEIPAQVELDIQMSDSLKDMRLMMMNQIGLVSDAEVKLKVGYDVDDSVVNELTEEEKEIMVKYLADGGEIEKFDEWLANRKNIEIIAETFGVEDVEELALKLEGVEGLDGTTIQTIAEAIGEGDVESLQSVINGLDGNVVQAIAEALGYGDVEALKSAINGMQGNTVDAAANVEGQTEVETLQSSILGLTGKTVDVVVNFIKSGFNAVKNWLSGEEGESEANGTAHAYGTSGRAFKQGDWRTKKTENALVGELGREIVVTPNNRWHTVGDNGAEFVNIPRGSIVFNHRQTEELLANGKVTSNGGRGKAYASGTAYAYVVGAHGVGGGFGKVKGANQKQQEEIKELRAEKLTVNNAASSGSEGGMDKVGGESVNDSSSSSSSSSSAKDDFEETFDWIEVAISRVERAIDNLDQKANNIYKSWSSRNSALTQQIGKVREEIELQEDAAQRYLQEANKVGLPSSWAEKVRNGEVDISTVKDENLAEKIGQYQDWYEKYLDCIDAAEELRETEASLYAQRFENIQTQYDGILQGYEHTEAMLNEYISQAEEQGYLISENYYNALIDNEKQNIAQLKNEQADLIKMRDEAIASGTIAKYSQEWYDMCSEVDSVTQAIEEGTTKLIEYNNAIRDIDFEKFDLIQERISDVIDEADFLIELMSNDDLYDDKGKLTEQGAATLGNHALKHNTYMYSADDYGSKIAEIDSKIASGEYDPYDQNVIDKRREYIELQRECILNAEQEKEAIADLVSEGIDKELDALSELIDKKNESLEAEKDLYEYSKQVQEQTENIASIRKEMAAYENDTSEEARAKIQELKVSLEDAEADLKETEWDKYISDTEQILTSLYDEYELVLNQRLDDTNYLLSQVIDGVNATTLALGEEGTITNALGVDGAIASAIANAMGENGSIKNILNKEVTAVGTTLSSAMNSIWSVGDGNAKSILTTYGTDFQSKLTTTNTVLNGIKVSIDRMVDDVDKDAQKKVVANKTTTSAQKNPVTTSTSTSKSTTTTSNNSSNTSNASKVTDDTLMGIASAIWVYGSGSGWGNNPFREDKLKNKIGEANAKKVQDYINSHGSSGGLYNFWIQKGQNLDKYKYSAFKSGVKDIGSTQLAWTQEGRKQEFIVRPSDGAILTPIAKGDSVLNTAASGNIWQMANNPAEFIKDNLNLGTASVPNNSTVQSNVTQHFENITFSLPNVHGYNDLLREMQSDPKFEKLILSMTIDQIAGKSKLAKGKSIRG